MIAAQAESGRQPWLFISYSKQQPAQQQLKLAGVRQQLAEAQQQLTALQQQLAAEDKAQLMQQQLAEK